MSDWQPGASDQSSRWISRELSGLLEDASRCHLQPAAEPAFDVLIVGSGYGGAIAAAELAGSRDASGRKISVGLLERGREFLPGSFPAGMAELPTQLRGSLGGRRRGGEGLFDLRIGTDVSVVLANGLGGGSLINAGVMEVPADDVFDTRWPQALRDVVARKHWYGRAKELLGARVGGAANGISRHPELQGKTLPKTAVLKSMAPRHYREAAITVAMEGHVTSGGVKLNPCKLCGDCATGCNHGAKESLDTNLLVRAFRQGAQLYCGATVLRLQPAPGGTGWSVMVAYTDEKLRRQDGVPRWITARRVILAAGTMGSTEILLRSRLATSQLSLSPQLGQRFSGNGDMISFGYDYGEQARANAVADEDQPPSERGVGPTITGILDQELETGRGPARHIVIEEMAVPGALRRAAEESIATAVTLQALGEFDCKSHGAGRPDDDPYAVHRAKIRDMSIFAAIGDDGAAGSLQLATAADDGACDGQLEVVWPGANRLPLYDAQVRRIDQLARGAGFRGRTLANPLWRYLPDAMASLVGDQRGPVVTVHPLGGCAMGDSSVEGVVDDCGRVFNATAAAGEERCHEGLMVLDGAIIPSALATNPALTIAALSLRAVTSLRESWGWQAADAPLAPLGPRPQLADVEAQVRTRAAQPPQHTMVGVSERLSGPMSLRDTDGRLRDCWVELTLTYDPLQLSHLFRPKGDGRLEDAQLSIGTRPGSRGRLRIFRREEWEHLRQQSLSVAERRREEAKASRSFELRGSLTVLERERTSVLGRTLRGLGAWLLNRGLRDVFQGVVEALRQSLRGEKRSGPGAWELLLGVLRLASRAGEVRLFRYKLDIGAEILFAGPAVREGGQPIRHFDMPPLRQEPQLRGLKRITYGRPSNPWRQLQELELDWLDGPLARRSPRRLTLEPHYFAARGQPLLRIESQRDHVEALADFASLGAYFLRMLLSIHVWNMRKPDLPRPRQIERLPGAVPGLPDPEIHWLAVDVLGGEAVRMRLACYRSAAAPGTGGTGRPPVLLIHGYSASGTTYAHPALKPGLAPYLARAGHEVWIVDMRSSAGLPTAAHPWTFEQVALADIPAAVDFICKHGGHAQVDVVAHCMGAVMFSMAVLSADLPAGEIGKLLRPRDAADGVDGIDRFREQRAALPRRIRRAVLSQNGPVMVMSPQNIFRGYVMSYFGQLFGSLTYRFRPEPDEGRGADLLDRFLGSLPYPDDELLLENPWQPCRRTEHLAARHRMDALYGRTFTLENFDSDVLDRIDDFFGPLNLDTVAQVIHLAQHQTITSRGGRNRFVSRQSLQRLWTFKTLALHSEHNGLADIATLYRIEAVLKNAGCHVEKKVLRGAGHQDSLIGKTSLQTFGHIADFLGAPPEHQRFGVEPARQAFIADAPWLGPMLGRQDDGSVMLGLGASPQLGRPAAVALLPVERDGQGRWDCERLLQLLQLDPEDSLWFPAADADTDWLARPPPSWAAHEEVQALLVLPLYPQHACMGEGGFDPGDAAIAERMWSGGFRGLRQLQAFAVPSAGNPEQDEMKKAVARALREYNRVTDTAGRCLEPPALVRLPVVEGGSGLRLALGSCHYPPGILNELPAQASWTRLNARLDGAVSERPQLLVLTGDQVYADATAGLFDPSQADDRFRKPYETWLRNRQVRDTLRRLPLVAMLDDHEIDDNWEPLGPAAPAEARELNRQRCDRGVRYFQRFQRLRQATPDASGPLWSIVKHLDVPMFLVDTRTQRCCRATGMPATGPEALLGREQWTALRDWLMDSPRDRPRLIVSPSLLLPRHRDAAPAVLATGVHDSADRAARRADGWSGYPDACCALLDWIAGQQIHGVVFLSGDEHLGLHANASISRNGQPAVTVHSIHAPGLNSPYRFANARPADFILDENFLFRSNGVENHCELQTRVFEGAGFAHISLQPDSNGKGWTLACEFDAEGGGAARRWSIHLPMG